MMTDRIPTESVEGCALCAKSSREYNRKCRGCYVRDLSRTPEPHRKEVYMLVARLESREIAMKLRDDVKARYELAKGNYGTFAR